MSKLKNLLLLLSFLLLCACTPRSAQVIRPSAVPDRIITKTAMPAAEKSQEITNGNSLPEIPDSDPWAACASIGDSGVTVSTAADLSPEEFRRRVQITFMIQDPDLQDALTARRCMNGKVYVCHINDDNNCLMPVNFTAEPNQAMAEICKELKDGVLSDQAIPLNSAYAWGCQDGEAVILAQIREADASGFDPSVWFEIPAP